MEYIFQPNDTKFSERKNYYSHVGHIVTVIKIKKCGTYLVKCLDGIIFECPKRYLIPRPTIRPTYIVIDDISNAEFTSEQREKLIHWYKEFKLMREKK